MTNTTDPRSPFLWNTGKHSIFWTEAGERAARAIQKAKPGMSMDIKGRAVIDMAPKSSQAISFDPNKNKSTDRNQAIRKGGI